MSFLKQVVKYIVDLPITNKMAKTLFFWIDRNFVKKMGGKKGIELMNKMTIGGDGKIKDAERSESVPADFNRAVDRMTMSEWLTYKRKCSTFDQNI